MIKAKKALFLLLSCLFISTAAIAAENLEGNDVYVSGYSKNRLMQLLQSTNFFSLADSPKEYTVLDENKYRQIITDARVGVFKLLWSLSYARSRDLNENVARILPRLADIPYLATGAMGEGDWQPNSLIYHSGAVHIQQDPVYRLDGLNCQTLVQVVIALLHSDNRDQFDQNIIKVSYGAAGITSGDMIHFYNRNNFPEGDFNPINEKSGFLSDATSAGTLKDDAKTISETITRQNWFAMLQSKPANTVRVLSESDGPAMAKHFKEDYSKLNYPHFDSENVVLSYVPKELLATKQADGSYLPNQEMLDKIPTPAVIEIVRDPKKWNIKNLIGSDLSISHMGLLYRKIFKRGEVIFQKIYCQLDAQNQKVCQVTPVVCKENQCNVLMFAQATNAYPNTHYWYKESNNFVCSPNKPTDNRAYTTCNRVEQLPLSEYITRKQYATFPFMDTESIIGIHVEKLL